MNDMNEYLTYKGYFGSVQYSDADRVLHGAVQFISALVSYEGTDLHAVESAFREAVDDYLDLCQEQGEAPEDSFTGDLTVRVGTDLHREVARYCAENGVSLDAVIRDSLHAQLSGKTAN